MKTVFENEQIKVLRTGRVYDFIAVVENKMDKEIDIIFDNEECPMIQISANNWIGLLADDEDYEYLEELEAERFTVV